MQSKQSASERQEGRSARWRNNGEKVTFRRVTFKDRYRRCIPKTLYLSVSGIWFSLPQSDDLRLANLAWRATRRRSVSVWPRTVGSVARTDYAFPPPGLYDGQGKLARWK